MKHEGTVGYWMNETSGVLRPAIEAYLSGSMTQEQIAAMRAYLRQWMAGSWQGPHIGLLRAGIDSLTTYDAIEAWLDAALDAEIDPL
jgi:hypothetical protein